MSEEKHNLSRRNFLKSSGLAVVSGLSASTPALARNSDQEQLQVWSCGGLAEAFIPANQAFYKKTGVKIAYTGAFAAALGKSLLGDARTEIFAPRVVSLSKKLKDQGRMLWYKPLCFTRYVLAVPKGNPAGIQSIEDLARTGIRVVLSFDASPPGGKATKILLKKAGLLEKVNKNIIFNGDCVIRSTTMLAEARADVSIVEQRIIKNPRFAGKLEVIPIDEKYFPPPPMTFTIGLMKWAANPAVATSFIDFILSSEGQNHFENAGFIPAISLEGRHLIERYGV